MSLVKQGSLARSTARTDMNLHSSRSHAILTLEVEKRWTTVNKEGDDIESHKLMKKRISRLALVGLAGSEAMCRSFASQGGKADAAGHCYELGVIHSVKGHAL